MAKGNTKKGLIDALVAKIIPKLTTLLVDLIPKKTFDKLTKYPTLLEILLPSIGIGLRSLTNLPEEIAEEITEFFQEANQSIDVRKTREEGEEKNKDKKYSPDAVKYTAKIINNLMKRGSGKKKKNSNIEVNEENEKKVLDNFLKLIESYPDEEKNHIMFFLSMMGAQELKRLLSSDLEQIRRYINSIYKKGEAPPIEEPVNPSRKEEPNKELFERIKEIAKEIVEEVIKVLKIVDDKLNEEFKPDAPMNVYLDRKKDEQQKYFDEQKAKFEKKLEKKWYFLWLFSLPKKKQKK